MGLDLRSTGLATAVAWAVVLILVTEPGTADDKDSIRSGLNADEVGYQEYRQYCAVCHGVFADGNGLVVPVLKVAPTNLRTLSQRHGKPLPRPKLRDYIDGRPPLSHGSREMPIWGHRLAEGYPSQARDMSKRNIINAILNYLESIQQDRAADSNDD